jgi:hypothetical protein
MIDARDKQISVGPSIHPSIHPTKPLGIHPCANQCSLHMAHMDLPSHHTGLSSWPTRTMEVGYSSRKLYVRVSPSIHPSIRPSGSVSRPMGSSCCKRKIVMINFFSFFKYCISYEEPNRVLTLNDKMF